MSTGEPIRIPNNDIPNTSEWQDFTTYAFKKCPYCEGYNPETCERCKAYLISLKETAPSGEDAFNLINKIEIHFGIKSPPNEVLFTWEDYELDDSPPNS